MPMFAMLGGIGTLIVLWAGGREVIAGRMTVGSLVAFNGYLVLLSWPTFALGWIIGIWQRGVAGWARVRELLTTVPAIADGHPERVPMPPRDELRQAQPGSAHAIGDASNDLGARAAPAKPSIEVHDLSVFADGAADGRPLLDGVSFTLPAGATLAIVGRTGSGKTTLVDAVLRMREVGRGTVRVAGRDVTKMPLAELRALIGYAPQDAFLFSATVADNIAFGIRDSIPSGTLEGSPSPPAKGSARQSPAAPTRSDAAARDACVRRAAEAAGLAPDVAVLPDGYDTLVGERGITLSGGQRQRVALARALAADPQILILDDSLSSVDAETERAILTRLRPILAGRTSVLISHRVAAVKDADQILVLEGGRVAESGTHGALLASGGIYASLYREQLAQEAVE
jgi:ATP-binding cassette subfamily B protein